MKNTLQQFGMALALLAIVGNAAAEDLAVMTSYPEEVVSRFEEAFEKSHPDIHVQILWRMPHDALPYLLQPKQGGVDVYWTPSQNNFLALKAAKALGPIGIDRIGLPDKIGDAVISDPDGLYLATETAGYGMVIDPYKLGKLGVAEPKHWEDLADPRLKGEVVLPVPSGVGYAPMLVDQLLQADGWEKGWNTWRAIAVNSKLIDKRGNAITEEISSGKAAVGLTMDFFVASTVASGGKGKFVYPLKTAFNPAQIGITASTTHRPAAEAFVSFILSEEGQSLLFHPAIRKLPVRPSVYAKAPQGYTNPFTLGIDARYDPVPGLARSGFNSALFDAAITHRQEALIKATAAVREAETGASPAEQKTLQQARTALEALPVTEPPADSALAQACEHRLADTKAEAQCAAAEREWDAFFDAHYAEAKKLAGQVLAARRGKTS